MFIRRSNSNYTLRYRLITTNTHESLNAAAIHRVITRSLLRFKVRSIETIQRILSAAQIGFILCHSSLIRWMFKYRTLSFVVRV
ncbi:hypothetical protein HanXRQr2_Chr04g0172921 [Helianthus annuus]|uniref:Uncharacterized protein n=1 Tax=Helianthus annuus TaxID=4232 RepID=A0A9K3J8Z2_HELAN|nr:hypothetical protein HanXRQr2_Chr04g0172921 [Helianthus annuus]KAJ0589454.1 hypothetical protein HanIR_Chr04g0186451 [Helianthus annuus]KAJ0931840.1 hypothetical protein HanPSC8_Chr04g0166621 [Helianthus annuus]